MVSTKMRWLMAGSLCLALLACTSARPELSWKQHIGAGIVAYQQGNYAEAEKQWKAGLKAAQAFRTQDPRYATSLNILAGLKRAQGRYAEAEPLHKRSRGIREKVLGPEDPDVARSLNNLAGLYHAQVLVPDYEGSDDNTFAAAPLIRYKYFPSTLYVQLIGNKLYANVIHHENWEFGPMVIHRLSREDVDDTAIDKTSDLDDSLELGLFLGYAKKFSNKPRQRMNIHLDVTQDSGQFFAGVSVLYSW